jgi:uncharacterized protein
VIARLWQFALLFAGMLALFAGLTVAVTLLTRRIGEARLRRWLGGGAVTAPLKGLAVGALTPFCSWSTVPVLLGLLQARVRTSAVAAFYLASPVLDPVLVVVLAVLFGVPIAAGFTAFIAVAALLGALLAERLRLERFVLARVQTRAGAGDAVGPPERPWQDWRTETRAAARMARYQVRALVLPLACACAIGVAILGVAPRELIADVAGPQRPFAVLAAALLGVPLYLPTEALAPLGWALRDAGVGTGAIFALIITAAGLSIPEFSLLAGIVRARVIVALVALVLAIAVLGGLAVPRLGQVMGA